MIQKNYIFYLKYIRTKKKFKNNKIISTSWIKSSMSKAIIEKRNIYYIYILKNNHLSLSKTFRKKIKHY